jgi:hypothetical protein
MMIWLFESLDNFGGAGGDPLLAAFLREGTLAMARYEHLPIYNKALPLVPNLHFGTAV